MTGPKITWLGHAGFRIEVEYNQTPDDADLILVTHGHLDHSQAAPVLLAASKKPNCAIVSISEIGLYYQNVHKVDQSKTLVMNKSGTRDFGWCKVTMVNADHSSSCGMHQGNIFDGGAAAGYVIRFQ